MTWADNGFCWYVTKLTLRRSVAISRIIDHEFYYQFLECMWLWTLKTALIECKTQSINYRSSRPEVFCKKGVLWNFAKFTGKQPCQSLFFNKVAGLRPETLFKKRLWHRCFPVNFVKFLRTPFFTEHLWRLFLYVTIFLSIQKLVFVKVFNIRLMKQPSRLSRT